MSVASRNNMIVFSQKYGNHMLEALNGSNIFFPLMLSQASLESGYGTSKAAINKNNFFGVMSGNVTKKFDSAREAFAKQVELFYKPTLPYLANGVTIAKTPYEQARKIADSGYYSMNNDETLKGKSVVRGCTWSDTKKRWIGCNFSDKQSANWYYSLLKGMIDDALIAVPVGKVDASAIAQAKSIISGLKITTL
jgi:hypothetical protein